MSIRTQLNKLEQDRILGRVRKMLRLADNAGATEGERDNALRMAHSTLAKYNLELVSETVDKKARDSAEPREQHADTFMGYPWARQVAMAAAELFFCSYYYTAIRGQQGHVKHNFIGRHSNVITAHEMARYLVESIHKEARAYQRATFPHLQTQYTSFAHGAMLKIHNRCHALRTASEKPVPAADGTIDRSMSLAVIYTDEASENQKFLVAAGTKVKTAKSNATVRDARTVAAGAVYASGLSLDRQIR